MFTFICIVMIITQNFDNCNSIFQLNIENKYGKSDSLKTHIYLAMLELVG